MTSEGGQPAAAGGGGGSGSHDAGGSTTAVRPEPVPGGTTGEESWRSRFSSAASRRGIPLGVIATTVVVAVGVLDLNALVILLLWVLRALILYLMVALFVAVLLAAPVRAIERLGLPRVVAAMVVSLLAVAIFGGIIYMFTEPLLSALTRVKDQLPTLVRQAEHGRGWIGHLIIRLHLQRLVNQNLPHLTADIAKSLKPAQALSVGAAAVSTLVALSTIAVLSFFLLLEAPALWRGFLGLLRPERAARVEAVYNEASHSVTGYMLGNALTSIVAGLVVFVLLEVLGVPFAFLLAVWVALVDLLPLVGGLLAGVPVTVIALLHSVTAGVITLVVFIAYQLFENHVLNPIVMSRTVRLNPLWVLLAVLISATLGNRVGNGLGAFIGALLGIPIGGAVQVVFRELRRGPTVAGEAGGEAAGDRGGTPGGAGGERAAVP